MRNKKQIKAAEKSLSEWLGEEFGQTPVDMECMHDFEQNGLTYYIFKYRKEKKGSEFIGICGGFDGDSLEHCGHVFGTFDDLYIEETALELGQKMADFIRGFKTQQAAGGNLDEMFKANLKYISQTEMNAEKIAGQFVKTNSRFFLTVGIVDIPSGRVVVADPLCYMFGEHSIAPVLEKEIPAGSYPVDVSIYRDNMIGIRMCTARLKIKETAAVRYEIAAPLPETAAAKFKDGVMSGYPVDAGMMCFCDSKAAAEYADFLAKWHRDNPGKNHYDDYFAAFFADSEKQLPQFQREGGDFIEWAVPDTGNRLVMISSGLGDGFYQCYWGYDESGEICELIAPLMDPDIFEGAN